MMIKITLAPSLRQTPSPLSTAQHTPVDPTLVKKLIQWIQRKILNFSEKLRFFWEKIWNFWKKSEIFGKNLKFLDLFGIFGIWIFTWFGSLSRQPLSTLSPLDHFLSPENVFENENVLNQLIWTLWTLLNRLIELIILPGNVFWMNIIESLDRSGNFTPILTKTSSTWFNPQTVWSKISVYFLKMWYMW